MTFVSIRSRVQCVHGEINRGYATVGGTRATATGSFRADAQNGKGQQVGFGLASPPLLSLCLCTSPSFFLASPCPVASASLLSPGCPLVSVDVSSDRS